MKKSLFLFFLIFCLYITFLFLGNFQVDVSGFFLWNILENKSFLFIILGGVLFLSGKEVIDNFEKDDLPINK